MKDKQKSKILIVEDEGIVASDIKVTLSHFGYEVMAVVSSGKEALQEVRKRLPDLVLMDIKLSGKMDGVETTQKIQTLADIPIVYITALGNSHTFQRAKKTGPFGYVYKPLQEKEILATVETTLYKHWMGRELKKSEEKYRNIFENSTIGLYRTTPDGRILMANPALLQMLGYSSFEELSRRNLEEEGYEPGYPRSEFKERIEKEGVVKGMESAWIRSDGTRLFVRESARAVKDEKGNTLCYEGTVEDITEKKKAEEKLRFYLKEKETLLREIHHRVKNNLQVLLSLLRIQSRRIKDQHDLRLYKESQDRVRSMALIHEELYQSKDYAQVNFSQYIRTLSSRLFHAYKVDTNRIRISIEAEEISLDINKAVPLGLVLNELLTNAIQHAFEKNKGGTVQIQLHSLDKNQIRLGVKDDGKGFPQNVDFRNSDSMGMQLVCDLVKQLKGDIELKREKGTSFQITFEGK